MHENNAFEGQTRENVQKIVTMTQFLSNFRSSMMLQLQAPRPINVLPPIYVLFLGWIKIMRTSLLMNIRPRGNLCV